GMQCEIRGGPMEGEIVEVDYENIGMLGSNLGIGDFNWALNLNLLADKEGIDTITLGSVLAFATEAVERGLLSKDEVGVDLKWGDGQAMLELAEMIASRKGIGDQMAEGVRRFSAKIGKGSEKFAMHVKGLEISAYDCHAAPGMALAFGTSPIGAHHKDAWFIAWELKLGRDLITREKVERLIEMQRIRGGFFEAAVTCRLPWIELGFNLEWYPKFLKAVTGLDYTLNDLWLIADRIYNLVRAFWVRENPNWSRKMDYPPDKWFEEPLTKGPLKGAKLDRGAYDQLLSWYYEIRGWDERGIPTKATLKKSGLDYVIEGLEAVGVSLS
ncbi:MAG TPA: aldehyde ferredoxin oxidoreductase, partial [Candidatus Korarchaeota archaeon]|nr:aldehyde ferredoxin oxidoreductase [Candidatus Korarchaeota archaeon]